MAGKLKSGAVVGVGNTEIDQDNKRRAASDTTAHETFLQDSAAQTEARDLSAPFRLNNDQLRAQDDYSRFLAAQSAPGITAPLPINASTASFTGPVGYNDPGAAVAARGYGDVQANLGSSAERINGQNAGAVERSQAAQSQAATARGALIDGTKIDATGSSQIRGQQQDLTQALRDRMEGRGPSVGQAQYDLAKGEIASQALGAAAQARGNDAVAARRDAIRSIGEQEQKAALSAALIRAQESAAASGQLGSVLDSTRGQDIGLATTQAGLTQGANLANQANTTQVNLANADAQTRVGMQNAVNQQGVSLANAASANQRQEFNAGQMQSAALANQAAQNARDTQVAQLKLQASQGNQAAANQLAQFNAAQTNARADTTAGQQLAADTGNAGRQQQNSQFNAGQTQGADVTNAANSLAAKQLEQQRQESLRQAQLQASGQAQSAYGVVNENDQRALDRAAGVKTANDARTDKYIGAALGAFGTIGAAISDEGMKEDIRSDSPGDVDKFLSALKLSSYRYKNPQNGEGERHGIMAQDLEKSDIGRSVVKIRPDGVKTVDTQALTLALAGVVAQMSREKKRNS